MFTTLYLKEWKEKAGLFFFELGILASLLATQFALREKKDIREWLIYAVLILFYPFAALVLGAAGFEAEYRQGAWAYLFSRPVPKTTVWLAKFAALLSMLAALWLVLIALWAAVPTIREMVGGTRILIGFRAAFEFPWWSLLASLFLLIVTFSLSLLHERQFHILFLALIIAFLLPAAAWGFMTTKAAGFLAWIAPEKALSAFLFFLGFIALAFAGASIMTLVRSDFSQPRKLTLGFVRRFAMFFVLALAGTAAWALLAPLPGRTYLWSVASSGGDAFFETDRGIFKYSAPADRVRWLAKANSFGYSWMTTSGGKIVLAAYDIKSKDDVDLEVWIMNADGGGRTKIIGRGAQGREWPEDESIDGLLLSPNGKKIAILSSTYREKRRPRRQFHLRLAGTDGTPLEILPDDPGLLGDAGNDSWLHMLAWARGGEAILLYRRGFYAKGAYVYPKGGGAGLWLYDLKDRSARPLLPDGVPASWASSVSPGGDLMVVRYQGTPDAPVKMALLSLESLAVTDIGGGEKGTELVWTGGSWDTKGERFAGIARRAQAGGPFVYVLNIYSMADGKIVAERAMTKAEPAAQLYAPSWTADGTRLVILDREANALRILGPDLRDIDRIDIPRWLTTPVRLIVLDNRALVADNDTNTLWRCDLAKKTWKKLY